MTAWRGESALDLLQQQQFGRNLQLWLGQSEVIGRRDHGAVDRQVLEVAQAFDGLHAEDERCGAARNEIARDRRVGDAHDGLGECAVVGVVLVEERLTLHDAVAARHPDLISEPRGRGLLCAVTLPSAALRDAVVAGHVAGAAVDVFPVEPLRRAELAGRNVVVVDDLRSGLESRIPGVPLLQVDISDEPSLPQMVEFARKHGVTSVIHTAALKSVPESVADPLGYYKVNVGGTIELLEAMKEAGVPLDIVLEIDVPDQDIIDRMAGRRVHLASGRTYHISYNPPKVAGKDDVTGEDLIQRDDDKEETVKKRLDVYSAQTRPLVDYYSGWAKADAAAAPKYRAISGTGSVEDITARAFTALAG